MKETLKRSREQERRRNRNVPSLREGLLLVTLSVAITIPLIGLNQSRDGLSHADVVNPVFILNSAIVFPLALLSFYLLWREVTFRKKIKNTLQEQTAYFIATLTSMTEGLITTDKSGKIVYMNPAAEKMTGWKLYEAKEMPFHKVYTVFNESTGLAMNSIVDRILKHRQAIEPENNTVLKTKWNTEIIIDNSGTPLFNSTGEISGTLLVFNDMTEKYRAEKKLRKNEKYLLDIVNTLPEAVYTCNSEGYIQLYNKAAESLWGLVPLAGKDKWCGSWKVFRADNGSSLPMEKSPMARAIKTGKPVYGEQIKIQRPDGSFRYVLPYPTPLFDEHGHMTGAVNMMIDITEKKESEEKFRSVMETSPVAMFIYKENHFEYANPAALKLSGYDTSDLSRLKFLDLVHPGDQLMVQQRAAARLKGESVPVSYELRMITQKGETRWVEFSGKMINYNREPAVIGIANDITERKKYEKDLEDYKYALDKSSIVAITDQKGIIRYVNDNFCKISGFNREELIGQDHRIVKSGLHSGTFIRNLWVTVANGKIWRDEICNRAKDGSLYWVDTTIVPFLNEKGKPYQYLVIRNDITERKKTEEKIIASEKNFRSTLDNMIEGVLIVGSDYKYIYLNDEAEKTSQYSRKELIGCTMMEKYPGIEKTEIFKAVTRCLQKRTPQQLETEFTFPNGQSGWFQVSVQPVKEGVFILYLDITERKKSEEDKQKALERYDILTQATSDTIWDWDIRNNGMFYNYGIVKMFGYEIQQVENVHEWWQKNIHPEDADRIIRQLEESFSQKKQVVEMEYRYRSAKGYYKNILDRAFAIYDSSGAPLRMIGSMQDITYRKEEEIRINKAILEAQEAERRQIGMELHDNVNQILSVVITYIGLIGKSWENEEKKLNLLSDIKIYVNDAIREIRQLSHKLAPATFDVLPLNELIESLLFSFNPEDKYQVDFQYEVTNNIDIPQDIQINLYRIIQEQLSNIGKYANASKIEIQLILGDGKIKLGVRDDGKGFDPHSLKNGIGFENMKRRAEVFNGDFYCNSAPGKGCEIVVSLPFPDFG